MLGGHAAGLKIVVSCVVRGATDDSNVGGSHGNSAKILLVVPDEGEAVRPRGTKGAVTLGFPGSQGLSQVLGREETHRELRYMVGTRDSQGVSVSQVVMDAPCNCAF